MTLTGKRQLYHFHGNRLYFAPGWEKILEEIGLTQGSHWDKLEPGEPASLSKRAKTYKVTLSEGETVYFKRYLLFGKPLKYFLRPSKASVEVFSYREMAKLGIPIAEPLALGEIRRYGSLFAACIVTRGIPNSMTLKDYAIQEWPNLSEELQKRVFLAISTTLRHHLQTMHRAHFFHFDPKWRNILIRSEPSGELAGLWWIDSPRGKKLSAWRYQHGVVHDLASLCRMALSFMSRSQRLRFLHNYCGPDTTRKEIKKLVKKIDRHLQRTPPRKVNASTWD